MCIRDRLPGPLIGRYRAAAASMAGHLHLVGGKAHGETLSSCERFDPRQCRWDAMRKPRKRGSVAGEVSASLSSVISRLLSEQPEIELSSIYVDAAVGEQAIARNISFSDMDDEVVSISSEVSTSSMWC